VRQEHHVAHDCRPRSHVRDIVIGDVVNDVPPKDRDIAMVFQNYASSTHDRVREMSFGRSCGAYLAEIKARVRRQPRSRHHRPLGEGPSSSPEDSGNGSHGTRYRAQPEGLPFDEPLSNLDAKLRDAHRDQAVHQQVKTTTGLRHSRPGRGDARRSGGGDE
jgi:ABC-type uncharacterized transport system YnjBCD ATPase subunit